MKKYLILKKNTDGEASILMENMMLNHIDYLNKYSTASGIYSFESLKDAETMLQSAYVLISFNAVDFEIHEFKVENEKLVIGEQVGSQSSEETMSLIKQILNATNIF